MTLPFAKEISDTLVKIHNCNGINNDTFNYLIPQDPRTARFYLLPKIHINTHTYIYKIDTLYAWVRFETTKRFLVKYFQ